MVTILVQADLGGSLAESSFVQPVLRPLSLVWLASLIRSIVHVRETVEQKRFVEPLFSLLGEEGKPPEKNETLWRRAATAASTRMSFSAGTLHGSTAAAADAAVSGTGGYGSTLPSVAGGAAAGGAAAGGLGWSDDQEEWGSGNGADDSGEDPKPWLPPRFFSSPDASAYAVSSAEGPLSVEFVGHTILVWVQ